MGGGGAEGEGVAVTDSATAGCGDAGVSASLGEEVVLALWGVGLESGDGVETGGGETGGGDTDDTTVGGDVGTAAGAAACSSAATTIVTRILWPKTFSNAISTLLNRS